MIDPIVSKTQPITLIGGAQVWPDQINISCRIAPTLVAADGGANHLLEQGLVPEAVIGDLDSLSPAAREAFADRLHRIDEQDTTDLEKVLVRTRSPFAIALGFLGGRLDHQLSILSVLARFRDRRLLLLGAEDVAFVIPEGVIRIGVSPGSRMGLLPLAPQQVSTEGLRWDLSEHHLAPDGAVSSSNRAEANRVTVRTDGPLLLTLPPEGLQAAIDALHAE